MAAAIGAAQAGCQVVVYEKNEKLGKKIYITGKGRCNVTNSCDTEDLFSHMVSNGKFLYSAIYGFSNFDVMGLMGECGCPLKIERGNRVFPVSDKSSDVIAAMERRMKRLGVSVRYNEAVKEVVCQDGPVSGRGPGKRPENGRSRSCDRGHRRPVLPGHRFHRGRLPGLQKPRAIR